MSDVQDVDVKDQQNLVPEKIYTPKRFQFDDKLDFDERPIDLALDSREFPNGVIRKVIIKKGGESMRKELGSVSEHFRINYKLFIAPTSKENEDQPLKLFQQNEPDTFLDVVPAKEEKLKALEMVLPTMREGETAHVFASHHYGFGNLQYTASDGSTLPEYTNLIVEVELVKIAGDEIVPGKSSAILKSVLNRSDKYGGPQIGAKFSATIKTQIGDQEVDRLEINDGIFGIDPLLENCYFKCLKSMHVEEFSRFEIRSGYYTEKFGSIGQNNFVTCQIELKSIEKKPALDSPYLTKLEKMVHIQELVNKATAFIKSGSKIELEASTHIFKFACNKAKYLKADSAESECEESDDDENSKDKIDTKIKNYDELKQFGDLKSAVYFKALANLSLTYIKRKKLRKSTTWVDRALDVQPSNVKLLLRNVNTHLILKNPTVAEKFLKTALEIDPENKDALAIQSRCTAIKSACEQEIKDSFKNVFSKMKSVTPT